MSEEKEEQTLTPEQEELHRLVAAYDGSVPFPQFVEMKADLSLDITTLRDMAQAVMLANDPRYAPITENMLPVDVAPSTSRENVPSIRRQQLEALQAIQHVLQAIYKQEFAWIAQCMEWRLEDKALGEARHEEIQDRWLAQEQREAEYIAIARERNAQELAASQATLAMHKQWRKEDVERVERNAQMTMEMMRLQLLSEKDSDKE